MDQHDIRRAIARLTPGQALTLARQARAELDRREARRRHSNPGRNACPTAPGHPVKHPDFDFT